MYIKVLKSIEKDLVFSDKKDEDDFYYLVDENRSIDDFKPKKTLISEMEKEGLIEAIEKETKRKYYKVGKEKKPFSLISIYEITDKGYEFLKNKK